MTEGWHPSPLGAPFPVFRISSRSHLGTVNPARGNAHSPENSLPDLSKRSLGILRRLRNKVFLPSATRGKVKEIQSTTQATQAVYSSHISAAFAPLLNHL